MKWINKEKVGLAYELVLVHSTWGKHGGGGGIYPGYGVQRPVKYEQLVRGLQTKHTTATTPTLKSVYSAIIFT